MSFKKNPFLVTYGYIACVMMLLGVVLFLGAAIAAARDPDTGTGTVIVFLFFSLFGLVTFAGTIYLITDCNSKVYFSEEGITTTSRLCKLKTIAWSDCRLIGLFGFYYGLRGILFFSTENLVCLTQADCHKAFKKHSKTAISLQYTPEVFAAVEQYAPPHLVSRVKMLMR